MSTLTDKRMTLAEADAILAELYDKFPAIKMVPAGSYRRKKDNFGDLDIVVIVPDLNNIRKMLESLFNIHSGGSKRILSIHRSTGYQVDFYSASQDCYEAMLLTLTGSAHLNIWMRSNAKKLGMRLNQYGLWKNHQLVACTERGIFEALGMKYLEPEERSIKFENWG